MKYVRILRIFGLAVILSLLIVAIPAAPALAATLVLSTGSGKIGDQITVIATGFVPSQPVIVYFSNQSAIVGQKIDTNVTVYQTLFIETADTTGSITKSFIVPSRITSRGNVEVTAGTYYLYACLPTAIDPNVIQALKTFTVTGTGIISIVPTTGPIDTPVDITGSAFTAATSITVKYDGASIPIEGGASVTNASGGFTSTIYVPESTTGTHTISVTVGSSEVIATFTVEPEITLSPQSGKAGTEVTISGTGFARRPTIDFYFNNKLLEEILSYTSDTKGSFTATVTIPSGLSARVYTLEADDGTNAADASFTLLKEPPPPEPTPEPEPEPEPTPSEASLDVTASGNTIGSLIGIGGNGFTPNGAVTLKYDDTLVATDNADASGFFVVTFQAPPSTHGAHKITASDGTKTAETTFTVESVAPDIPQPLLPEMGVKVKSPISFDWKDVTDQSLPVTYDLQIATTTDFSAGSVVLEKTGIETSQYLLTEAEELKLAAQKAAYYWRVKATDAASNVGAWTGAGELYVAPPFSFPKWALYTLLGIGGVFIFVIGYLLGRRTAFYY